MWYSFPISFLFVSVSSPSSSSFSCTVFSEFAGIFVVVAVVCFFARECVFVCANANKNCIKFVGRSKLI